MPVNCPQSQGGFSEAVLEVGFKGWIEVCWVGFLGGQWKGNQAERMASPTQGYGEGERAWPQAGALPEDPPARPGSVLAGWVTGLCWRGTT